MNGFKIVALVFSFFILSSALAGGGGMDTMIKETSTKEISKSKK